MVISGKVMKKLIVISFIVSALTGCSGQNQVYGLGVVPQSISGDKKGVEVFNVWSGGDAQPLADRHCRQYDKDAIFQRMRAITAIFTCE
jgi:hypothetical protein